MKIPEKAPYLGEIDKNDFQNFMKQLATLTRSDDFKKLTNKANAEYLYWDRFKYVELPEGIRPEFAWLTLKISRSGMAKPIQLTMPTGDPFSYWVPDSAQAALHFIDQNAGGQILVEEPFHKKEKEHYLMKSIVEEAIASSLIEGAATTRIKAVEMFKTGRKPHDRGEQMIYNNYLTILRIKDLLDKPLSPEMLREIQGSMTKDTLEDPSYEGRFRTETDEAIEIADSDGQVLYVPPPASEIPRLIEDFCAYANRESEEQFIHPVIKGIILHFWLAYTHPFMDGNGRTSRAIFYWYLLKQKYWLFEYLSISRIILKAPAQYYRAFLYSEMDDGDITYFITFHLGAINLAIKELKSYLERKQKESIDAIRKLSKYPNLNYRQRALLLYAISHPDELCSFQTHMKAHRVVYQTARNDLFDLVNKGFLEKIKIGKKFSFKAVENLEEKLET